MSKRITLNKGLMSPLVKFKYKNGKPFIYETDLWLSFWRSATVPKAN